VALSINGFGTTFYGRRLRRPDGSYVTTKWFILAFLPILPLESARLKDSRRGFSRQEYEALEDIGLDWVQVLNTYVYVYLLFPLSLYWLLVKRPEAPAALPWVLALAFSFWPILLLVFLPHVLRLFSKEGRTTARRR
jgi:hypothetical protein